MEFIFKGMCSSSTYVQTRCQNVAVPLPVQLQFPVLSLCLWTQLNPRKTRGWEPAFFLQLFLRWFSGVFNSLVFVSIWGDLCQKYSFFFFFPAGIPPFFTKTCSPAFSGYPQLKYLIMEFLQWEDYQWINRRSISHLCLFLRSPANLNFILVVCKVAGTQTSRSICFPFIQQSENLFSWR